LAGQQESPNTIGGRLVSGVVSLCIEGVHAAAKPAIWLTDVRADESGKGHSDPQ